MAGHEHELDMDGGEWQCGLTEQGIPYYWHPASDQSAWTLPGEDWSDHWQDDLSLFVVSKHGHIARAVHAPWHWNVSEDGRPYYYNEDSQEVSWTPPMDFLVRGDDDEGGAAAATAGVSGSRFNSGSGSSIPELVSDDGFEYQRRPGQDQKGFSVSTFASKLAQKAGNVGSFFQMEGDEEEIQEDDRSGLSHPLDEGIPQDQQPGGPQGASTVSRLTAGGVAALQRGLAFFAGDDDGALPEHSGARRRSRSQTRDHQPRGGSRSPRARSVPRNSDDVPEYQPTDEMSATYNTARSPTDPYVRGTPGATPGPSAGNLPRLGVPSLPKPPNSFNAAAIIPPPPSPREVAPLPKLPPSGAPSRENSKVVRGRGSEPPSYVFLLSFYDFTPFSTGNIAIFFEMLTKQIWTISHGMLS
jgi:hypothetical protein